MIEIIERLTVLCAELLDVVKELSAVIEQNGITVIGKSYDERIQQIEKELRE